MAEKDKVHVHHAQVTEGKKQIIQQYSASTYMAAKKFLQSKSVRIKGQSIGLEY